MGSSFKRKKAREYRFGLGAKDAAHPRLVPNTEGIQPTVKVASPDRGAVDEDSSAATCTQEIHLTNEAPTIGVVPLRKAQRFIVFVGNLPYSTTDQAIKDHFARLRPSSIRHRTDRQTGKSKGFAFIEFEGYDRLKTCLKLFHHSIFNDGETPGRRINVELTAGGGGVRSKSRNLKIRTKNAKLNDQRRRFAANISTAPSKADDKAILCRTFKSVHDNGRVRIPVD